MSIPGGGQDSPTRLHCMRELGATALVCTPSYALHLAEVAQGQGFGQRVFGVPAVARLADLAEPADVVEVFRRPQFLPGHAEEILAMPHRPAAVWFRLGIRHDGAAERLAAAGIRVVQDRCMMPEHWRLLRSP